jgi:hypothetical protein
VKARLRSFGTKPEIPIIFFRRKFAMDSIYTISESATNQQPRVWLTASRSSRGAAETTESTGTRHRRRVPQLLVLAALVVTGSVLVGQPPAHAAAPRVTGLERVNGATPTNSLSPKYAFAECPHPKKAVGGGAYALYDDPTPYRRLVLTRSVPYEFGSVSGFRAAAVEASPTDDNWWVVAWAICADPLPGYHIVHSITAPSSAEVQTAEARCPSGRRALGSGAEILAPDHPHGVGLQVARASSNGDLTRSQAHEQPQGYDYDWQLVASAICGDTPSGYQVVYGESEEGASERRKYARAYCSGFRRLTGVGAAVSNVEPGDVALYWIVPTSLGGENRGEATAGAVWTSPLSGSWDSVVAQAICVAR